MRIAIFASGSGTNAENIAIHFEKSNEHVVSLILTNNPQAGVLLRARNLNIPCLVFSQEQLNDGYVLNVLLQQKIDFVVLAGFLKLVPESIIEAFEGRIINIHPALLPKYGGKGMYGGRVHQAVFDAREAETGITIHHVTAKYDEGNIIFQTSVAVEKRDSVKDIESKVHALEYRHYPEVINDCLDKLKAGLGT
jgi:phosphoribosylglycinamide formyltransferase-1